MPKPSDDDSLLERVLLGPPESGRSIDEVSRPNECAGKLSPKKEESFAITFDDTQDLDGGPLASATLRPFEFEADARAATHFYYKLNVSKRVARTATAEYAACCKEKGSCGYGFVSALVYGDGEYATVRESSAGAVTIRVGAEEGWEVRATILHERTARGYVAAIVTVTDPAKRDSSLGPFGLATSVGITEASLPDASKGNYESERLRFASVESETNYKIVDGNNRELTENEFVERYERLTGSRELEGADRVRDKGLILGSVLGLVASGTLVAVGAFNLTNPNDRSVNVPSAVTMGTGIAGALVSGSLFSYSLTATGGSATDHVIARSFSEVLVDDYNRTLLMKLVRQKQRISIESRGSATLRPMLSAGFVGLVGIF